MKQLRAAIALFAVQQCLIGCAAPDVDETSQQGQQVASADQSSTAELAALEADVGGPVELMKALADNSEADVRDLLAAYGMAYVVHEVENVGPAQDKYIGDCPQYFPSSDRNTWHNFDGEFYYVDAAGRPQRAYKYLPPVAAAPRNETCQGNVGRWGDAENPSNNYDGGHIIGAQLGGWGKRANMVPQDSQFNQGNWNVLESAMAKCRVLSSGRMLYQVTLAYPNSSTLIPSTFSLYMQDRTQGDSISLSFQNVDYGGSNGTSERQRGVNFLVANGCN